MENIGINNSQFSKSIDRMESLKSYEDLSTIIICPTRGVIPAKVVHAIIHLMRPINQKIYGPIFVEGLETSVAYNTTIEKILTDPYLCQFKYILTIEDDNIPPVEGLLKLYENIGKYDAVGGLYWTKGEYGYPMMFGNPENRYKKDFKPQVPKEGEVVEVNGLGMGFTLFKLDMFRKVEFPWFKTIQEYTPEGGKRIITQDIYFFDKAGDKKFKFAVDCRVLVGHYDVTTNTIY